jgi:hypothetical protein
MQTPRQQTVVRGLTAIARDLDAKGYWAAGMVRQLAREVALLAFDEPAEPGLCACGRQIVQPRTGRPRQSCVECSPPRKTHAKRDDCAGSRADMKGQ